jgi:hypothetical protein
MVNPELPIVDFQLPILTELEFSIGNRKSKLGNGPFDSLPSLLLT